MQIDEHIDLVLQNGLRCGRVVHVRDPHIMVKRLDHAMPELRPVLPAPAKAINLESCAIKQFEQLDGQLRYRMHAEIGGHETDSDPLMPIAFFRRQGGHAQIHPLAHKTVRRRQLQAGVIRDCQHRQWRGRLDHVAIAEIGNIGKGRPFALFLA